MALQSPIPIPKDSLLNYWFKQFDNTEIWPSWRIATGLSTIGALMGRRAYFDLASLGRLWPNVSALLVGGSGTGKNTIIEPAEVVLDNVWEKTGVGVPYVQGKTMEAITQRLWQICQKGGIAEGYLSAKELKEFFGGKDYQGGMIETLTELLSTGRRVDITNKGDMMTGQQVKFIKEPTITMFGGSTPEWMQMIPGLMQGGFLPRFIVMCEMDAKRIAVANPARYNSLEHQKEIEDAKAIWQNAMCNLALYYRVERKEPMVFREHNGEDDAEAWFSNWYENRYKSFSPNLRAYAERASSLCRRVAMLMAASRGREVIDIDDYKFAAGLIIYAAERLERSVLATAREIQVANEILPNLPMRMPEILRVFSPASSPRWVRQAMAYLIESEQVLEKGHKFYRVDDVPKDPKPIPEEISMDDIIEL